MPLKYEDDKYGLPDGIAAVVRTHDLTLEKIKDQSVRDATIEAMAERMREHYRETGQKSFPPRVHKDLRAILDRALQTEISPRANTPSKKQRAKELADRYRSRETGANRSQHERER